jgi:hypothetical protein
MNETDLVRRLRDEESDATAYYTSELAKEQATLLQRYQSAPFGTEKENRSQVVTPDAMDAVNWALPSMLRPFLSSEDFLTVESKTDADVSMIGDYLGHVFFVDNPGQQNLHDYAFDGMVQRVGIIKTSWQDPEPKPPREYEGLSQAALLKYSQDPEYKVGEVLQEDDGTISASIQHTPRMGRVRVECVAPEDFMIARRAKSVKEAAYHAVIHRGMRLSDIFRMFPDKQADIEYAASETNTDDDTRISVRFSGEADRNVKDGTNDIGSGRVDLLQEYVRGDYDEDGAEELRAIKRVGNVILENIVIDEPEVAIWSPIKIAHKAIGLSLVDTVVPYQKIRTELTRRALDNMAQVLIPQKAINIEALEDGPGGAQALANGDIGATMLVRGDATKAVAFFPTPDTSATALQGLEYFAMQKQEASGISAHLQGQDAQKLHDTAQGVDLIQSASNSRVELMARWYAEGLESVFNRILKLICQHQDQPRTVKLRGKPMEVNPSLWPDDMMVRVHVGMAASSRERQIANLSIIIGTQKEILLNMGPSNPIVGIQELRNSLARLAEAQGYKDPTAFYREIPQDYQPPPPGKDPKQVEAEGKIAIAQAESQAKQQQAQGEAAAKIQLEREKAVAEMQLAREKAAMEMQLARERLSEEFKLKALEVQMNAETQRMLGAHKNSIDGAAKSNLPDNRPGGKLDA